MDLRLRRNCQSRLFVPLLVLGCLGATLALLIHRFRPAATIPEPRCFSRAPTVGRWPTPTIADTFDYPLQPPQAYGPYTPGVTGIRAIDTRFGAQNPALGDRTNCFRDADGSAVPFNQLYHAGVDLFSMGPARQLLWGSAADDPVHSVADGVAVSTLDAGTEGRILITQHLLPDQSIVYAVYWHVDCVQVAPGQPVMRGQVVASIYDQGLNSHLHWEMRRFLDGGEIFPEGTAGARGSCNGHLTAVGYTWDDTAERSRPEFYGYLDPLAFVASHR